MLYNYNFSKMRCRKLAWMIEDHVWKWHLVFTDHMNNLIPKHAVAKRRCLTLHSLLNFGSGIINMARLPNGPNE